MKSQNFIKMNANTQFSLHQYDDGNVIFAQLVKISESSQC